MTDFKGIEGAFKLNFDSDVVFLSGPNGYGKTTIYDAIELCVTGKVGRIEDGKSSENANKRHQGSVLHNKSDRDIVIQLELKMDDDTKVIKVTYPKSSSTDHLVDWSKLVTELCDEVGAVEGSRVDVTKWLGINQDNYRLFTYLQQADNTYFLKRAQKDRHNLLSPLLDSSGRYSEEVSSIDGFKRQLSTYKTHLDNQLKSFNNDTVSTGSDVIAYERLIQGEHIHPYDIEDPFKKLEIEASKAEYKKILYELRSVSDLLEQFNPDEYIKSEKLSFLNTITKDRGFCRYIACQRIIKNEVLTKLNEKQLKVYEDTQDTEKVKKYVLRNTLREESYSKFKDQSEEYLKNRRALYSSTGESQSIDKIMTYVSTPENNFSQADQKIAADFLTVYTPLAKATDTYGKVITELQRSRRELREHFVESSKLNPYHAESTHTCPFCGIDWPDETQLLSSIDKETESIQALLTDQSKELSKLEEKIRQEYVKGLIGRTDKIKDAAELFKTFKATGMLNDSDILTNSAIDEIFPRLKDMAELVSDGANESTETAIRLLQEHVSNEMTDNSIKIARSIINLRSKDYSKYLDALGRLNVSIDDTNILDGTKLPTTSKLVAAENAIVVTLEDTAKQISVKPELALPEHVVLYKNLFQSDRQQYINAKKKIGNKRKYIEQKFGDTYLSKKKDIEAKHVKILSLISKVNDLRTDYANALKNYQHSLTKNIQLPFYIYSAKILQNSPQCQGVFMYVQENLGTVVFTPERGATHDVIHQLSSGQLVVVSMAFYLALNTVFKDQTTKLMAIDDPIQDLDSLNVHSLVELMRREFVGKYQLIVSAHSELDINYMKYKFGTALEDNSITDIDVQETFFKANQPEVIS